MVFPATNDTPTELQAQRDRLASDLDAMTLLHEISTRFVQEGNTRSLFEQIVDAAIQITGADMGNIQILDRESGKLKVIARRSYGMALPACCKEVGKHEACCSMAVLRAERIVIDDVRDSPLLAGKPSRDGLLAAGVRSVQATPLFTRAGELVGMLSTHCRTPRPLAETELRFLDLLARQVADMIESKRLEKELLARRNEMEALTKHQVAAQTAAAIAHDLNQPLVAISAYSEVALRMLRSGAKDPDKLVHALEGSVEQAQRAGRTLHQLLDFLHNGETVAAPLDLAATVQEAVAMAQEGGDAAFQAVLELADGLPPVLANRVQVQKVLDNLVLNAAEAMHGAGIARGEIAVSVGPAADGGMAQVTVRDSGPGLDTASASRVFEPFFTTKPRGIGLGLAISRALVEAHGGVLWAEPGEGPGAVFHFTLPFAR